MNLQLNRSIDNLYDTFSKYHVEANLRARSCHCCVTNEEVLQLLSKPLKELNKDELYHFMTSAITTYGDVNDYKHFLPRILELIANDTTLISDFLAFEKLNYSEWETWDTNEIYAIETYFLMLWKATITNEDVSFYTIKGVLEIIEKYVGLNKALEVWDTGASNKSVLFIIDFIWNTNNYKNSNYNVLLKWLSKSIIKQKIEDLFFKTKNKNLALKLSIIYTMLDDYENN